jgi:hypothetical protein
MSLFSTYGQQGQLNAGSVQDALHQIVKYASVLNELQPSNTGLAQRPSVTSEQRDELIKRALLTSEGKIALGQAMANPIRRNLDYQGVARRVLVIDPLIVAAV